MGILLVGVVAALFFRNEPLAVDDSLSARREKELNQRLRDRDVAVYLDPETDAPVDNDQELQWKLKDLFDSLEAKDKATPVPLGVRPVPVAVNSSDTSAVESIRPLRFEPPSDEPVKGVESEPVLATSSSVRREALPPQSEPPQSEPQSSAAETDVEYFEEYTVKFGDTLSGISKRFLGAQTRYREIYDANKDRIADPDRLPVGTAIRVPRVIH